MSGGSGPGGPEPDACGGLGLRPAWGRRVGRLRGAWPAAGVGWFACGRWVGGTCGGRGWWWVWPVAGLGGRVGAEAPLVVTGWASAGGLACGRPGLVCLRPVGGWHSRWAWSRASRVGSPAGGLRGRTLVGVVPPAVTGRCPRRGWSACRPAWGRALAGVPPRARPAANGFRPRRGPPRGGTRPLAGRRPGGRSRPGRRTRAVRGARNPERAPSGDEFGTARESPLGRGRHALPGSRRGERDVRVVRREFLSLDGVARRGRAPRARTPATGSRGEVGSFRAWTTRSPGSRPAGSRRRWTGACSGGAATRTSRGTGRRRTTPTTRSPASSTTCRGTWPATP